MSDESKIKIEFSGTGTITEIFESLNDLAMMIDIVGDEVEKINWNCSQFNLKLSKEDK